MGDFSLSVYYITYSIIAILAAILFPVFVQFRETMRYSVTLHSQEHKRSADGYRRFVGSTITT